MQLRPLTSMSSAMASAHLGSTGLPQRGHGTSSLMSISGGGLSVISFASCAPAGPHQGADFLHGLSIAHYGVRPVLLVVAERANPSVHGWYKGAGVAEDGAVLAVAAIAAREGMDGAALLPGQQMLNLPDRERRSYFVWGAMMGWLGHVTTPPTGSVRWCARSSRSSDGC